MIPHCKKHPDVITVIRIFQNADNLCFHSETTEGTPGLEEKREEWRRHKLGRNTN